ncbi:MAG: hypothetical protein AAF890_09965 [Pseudomonadota bacterium]
MQAAPEGESQTDGLYAQFLNRVQAIWSRHGMHLLMHGRLQFPEQMLGPNRTTNQSYGSLLRIESREQFAAYLSDPDYITIRPLRLAGVTDLAIVEAYGSPDGKAFEALLAARSTNRGSAFAIKLLPKRSEQSATSPCSHPCFQLSDLRIFVVKGAAPTWLGSVRTVTLMEFQTDRLEGVTWYPEP